MSAKRKTLPKEPRTGSKTRREIISTCQIQTGCGTPVTWTSFRRVGAPVSARPDYYVCTLPDNTGDETPSAYDLRAIAGQAKRFVVINLTALDQDVTYIIQRGGTSEEVVVPRGESFPVPPRGSGEQVTRVTLTFEGDCCTIEAVPTRPPGRRCPDELPPGTIMPMDSEGEPPPPLPDDESEN